MIRPELKGLRAHMPEHPAQEITRLLDVPDFTLDCVAADGACILPAAETFRVLTALEPLTLRWLEGEMELKAGDTVLLPAAWLLARTGSVNNVWWAFLIAEVVSLLLSLAFFARINKTVIAPLYGPEEP